MTLFETLRLKIKQAADENPTYRANFPSDFLTLDQDTLVNDAQRGDCYVSVLHGNNSGTNLLLCNCTNEQSTQVNVSVLDKPILSHSQPDKYFSVVVTGNNEGIVEEISQKEALRLVNTVGLSPYREPRRMNANAQVRKLIGCDGPEESRISDAIAPYLKTEKGQSYLVTLVADHPYKNMIAEVTPRKGDKAGVTNTVTFEMGFDTLLRFVLPKHARINCTSDRETDIKILDDKAYWRAYKSFQPKVSPASSVDLDGTHL